MCVLCVCDIGVRTQRSGSVNAKPYTLLLEYCKEGCHLIDGWAQISKTFCQNHTLYLLRPDFHRSPNKCPPLCVKSGWSRSRVDRWDYMCLPDGSVLLFVSSAPIPFHFQARAQWYWWVLMVPCYFFFPRLDVICSGDGLLCVAVWWRQIRNLQQWAGGSVARGLLEHTCLW